MSQEKAQLIAPQGHFTVPGLNVAGVVTASSFSGNCTGTASSIAQGTNVVVGVMTASSFAGDVFGNAAGLSTTTAGLKLGIVTATSFGGNFTGIGSGLTGTPNIVAGLVTATQFVGNTPGLAAGISAGKNLAAGIVTATTFYGDGSNLTGAGSTAFIRQTVGSGTTIDLNNGNIIYFNHVGDTTVSFANTSTANDVTFIRPLTNPPAISISTGGVDFDGNDYLSLGADSDAFDMGTGDFTIECWIKKDSAQNTCLWTLGSYNNGMELQVSSAGQPFVYGHDGSSTAFLVQGTTGSIALDTWYHTALVRASGTMMLFIDGLEVDSVAHSAAMPTSGETKDFFIATEHGTDGSNGSYMYGIISNLRIIKGRALYTTDFYPPSAELTNVADTKLLCCQSTSDVTAKAVGGTISSSGDPTAGAQTITLSPTLGSAITWPTSITWNGGTEPTLASANSYSLTGQVFNLVTADGGTTWYGYEEVNNDLSQPYTLWGWGQNANGQLGQNDRTHRSSPTQITGNNWRNFTSNSYSYSTLATRNDGTLWSWGKNVYGELGQNQGPGQLGGASSPVQIPGTTWSDNLDIPYQHSVATKTDGTLWAWGKNDVGQLGQNNAIYYSSPVQVPGTSWSNVEGNIQTIQAIKTDGTLWAWGSNTYGTLGLNEAHAAGGKSSPVQVGSDTTWSKIHGNLYRFYGIKTDGTMWSWGSMIYGSLGLSETGGFGQGKSSPTQIPGTTWDTVIVGNNRQNAAIKTDGTLWTWGRNSQGELGHNNTTDYNSPKQVPGTTWSSFGISGSYMMGAIKTDGTAWIWGTNGYGKLGLNQPTSTTYSSPVQIPGTTWELMTGGKNTNYLMKPYNV